MLEIRLFGTPEVLWNNAPLALQRRACRAMLFYLAANGRAVDCEFLPGFLWPRASMEDGRARVRETLSRLRVSLPSENLMITTPETITLDFSQLRVDYLDFMRLTNTIANTPWRIPSEMPLPPSLHDMMNRLTALYRLPGFLNNSDANFSPALAAWRDNIHDTTRLMTLRCIDRLFEHALVSSSIEEALERLHDAIRIDPFNHARQARFLSAMLNAGLKQPARQHYLALETAYQNEGNLPLPEEITAFKARLFDSTRPASKNVFTWPLRPTVKAPFVGREASLSNLRRHFISGGGVIILGEAGSGKTRLVQEFYNRLNPSPRLLMGVCRPMASNLPFQPWIDLLRRCIHPHEWQALISAWAAPLARLMPELYEVRPDLDQYRSELEHPKSVFFEAVRQILLAASSNAPVIIFFDDVHWADDSSLGLLAYLLEQGFFTGKHGFLITTSRLEEHNPSLNQLLSASYLNRVNPIQLGQLSPEEIGQLIHHVLRETPPPGFAERLAREVGGNPFAILETIGAFLDRPARLSLGEITRLPLVSAVHQMILMRLRMVSREGRAVLHAAALFGGALKVGMLAQVVSLPEDGVVRAFEELEALHFIQRESVDGVGDYTFVHEKFRESLLQDISPANNYLFNRRIAEVLEEGLDEHGLSQAAIIAQHFEAAGMFPQAFDYWVKAAQYACDLSSVTEATELYKRAERLIARIPNLRDEQLYTLLSAWSDMAFGNDDPETLFGINRTLLSIGELRDNPLLIGTAHDGLSEAYLVTNQFAEGLAHAVQALQFLENCDNLFERLEAQNHCGVFLLMLGRLPEASDYFNQTIALSEAAQTAPVIRGRGLAYYNLSIIETVTGHPSEGLSHAQRALENYTRANWASGRLAAFSAMGRAHYYMGNYEAGYQACAEGIAGAERLDGWRMLGFNHIYAGHIASEMGRLGYAWSHAQKALELGERHQHAEMTSLAHKLTGDIYRHLRAYQPAIAAYQLGISASGNHFAVIESMTRLGVVLADVGDPQGLPLIHQAITMAQSAGLMTFAYFARAMRLRKLIEQSQYDLYQQETAELRPIMQERLLVDGTWMLDLGDIQKMAAQGNPHAAFKQLDVVLARSSTQPWFWTRLRAIAMKVALGRQLNEDVQPAEIELERLLSIVKSNLENTPLLAYRESFQSAVQAP